MRELISKVKPFFLPIFLGIILMVVLLRPQEVTLKDASVAISAYLENQQNLFQSFYEQNRSKEPTIFYENYPPVLDKAKLDLIVFQNDSLLFYKSNEATLNLPPEAFSEGSHLLKLKNGWYHLLKKKNVQTNQTWIALSLIKSEYKFENKFLENKFCEELKEIPSNILLSEEPLKGALFVNGNGGKPLCSLYLDSTIQQHSANFLWVFLYLFILLIIGYYIHLFALQLVAKYSILVGVGSLALICLTLRVLMLQTDFPYEFYRLEIFDPALYASVYFARSLGDLLISSLLVFWVVLFYFFQVKNKLYLASKKSPSVGSKIFHLAILLACNLSLLLLFKSLILDSVISFEVYDILSLNIYSCIGLLCIGLFFISNYLWTLISIEKLSTTKELYTVSGIFLGVSVVLLFCFPDYLDFKNTLIFGAIWLFIYLIIAFKIFRNPIHFFTTQTITVTVLLFSILSMFLIESLYEYKERNQRQFFANKLISSRDYIAEFTFKETSQKIVNDKFAKSFFTNALITKKDLKDRLSAIYFGGYFSKYDINVFAYDSSENPIKATDTLSNFKNFKELYEANADNNIANSAFRFTNDSLISASYLAILPCKDSSKFLGNLVIYLSPKLNNSQTVYPELLVGQSTLSKTLTNKYNFAIYKDGKLTSQHGDFPYLYYLDEHIPNPKTGTYEYYENEHWEHLIGGFPLQKKVIVSIKQEGFFEPVATISYFFIIYVLIVAIVFACINFFAFVKSGKTIQEEYSISFRSRINYSMLLIVIISFIVIGFVTLNFFQKQYESFFTDKLVRKEKAIQVSLEYLIQENFLENKPLFSKMELEELLDVEVPKLADVQNIDINIYDVFGELALSSQSSIFDYGLLSKQMNSTAFWNLKYKKETHFSQTEQIGNLLYTAAYSPIRNQFGQTIAYLNVPYFDKSANIKLEVSAFLVTLMNAYVFLLLCAAVLAYAISNSITRPLRFISEKLRLLNLSKKNEPILWGSKDEVGTLISEYNKMIAELENSAGKLAKSERESAWREMARQIAHEIKNPLTPMKLSIQYLQRAIEENNPNVRELAGKVNKTLIEQIENLSSIATAFSSFAQMPKGVAEAFDINDVLNNIISLFDKEGEVAFSFNSYKEQAMIYADKNQVISVFNNLIKNAIQSIPENRKGEIMVITLEEYGFIKVVIMDNGSGIPKESFEKVFVPNFTTKTSGTGLGLAITKQIIENSKGQIWFESEVNKGTTFYVNLPYYLEEV